MLLLKNCIDGQGGFWQPTEDDNMRCSRTTQVCHLIGGVYKGRAICCRSSCKWLFQVRPFATVYFTFLAFQCCQMLSKKQPKNKTRCLNELAKHRNQVGKTRHSEKSASLKLVQLAPRSFCHAVDGIWKQYWKSNFSRGELRKTSSKSAAPSAPLVSSPKHLECSKGDGGDIPTPWEDGISKKVRLCHLSPNPPKTSPLWEVGPIII